MTRMPLENCTICSQLGESQAARQKFGWEENGTHLPAAAADLVLVRDLQPGSSRELQLLQCPLCGTYYLYETDYEYLVNGSEDDQTLRRLTSAEAAAYLDENPEH